MSSSTLALPLENATRACPILSSGLPRRRAHPLKVARLVLLSAAMVTLPREAGPVYGCPGRDRVDGPHKPNPDSPR